MTHGCYDRPPMRETYPVQDGYWPPSRPDSGTRLPRIVQTPHRNTTDCQFTLHNPTDAGCAGCCHREKGAAA